MLISSVPPVHQSDLLARIVSHPGVDAVRYNTGMSSAFSPEEVVARLKSLADRQGKPVYLDLKGRQLRVIEWATPPYGPIRLNHRIRAELPAQVRFRGEDQCELKKVVDGNVIYVDPMPKAPVGRGQSVNILSPKLEIEGGLLDLDREYVATAIAQGVTRFLLSFVESEEDAEELTDLIRSTRGAQPINRYEIGLKIESERGLEFVSASPKTFFKGAPYHLMAARDDLMIQIGILDMPDALKLIIDRDPGAICASRLLLGLEKGGVSMADLSDLEYMKILGYRHFMLSDEISREHFDDALEFWTEYQSAVRK